MKEERSARNRFFSKIFFSINIGNNAARSIIICKRVFTANYLTFTYNQ